MAKNIRRLFLTFCAILFVASPVISLLSPSNASAEVKSYTAMSADQQIASYIFYDALKTCIYGGFINQKDIDVSSIDNMFSGQQHTIAVGLLAENVASKFTAVTLGDGEMRCESIAKAAFSMWGMTEENAVSLYEAIGYIKTDAYRCIGMDPRDDDKLKPLQEDERTAIPFSLSDYTLGTNGYIDLNGDEKITTTEEYSSLCKSKILASNWAVYTDKNGNEETYEPVELNKAYVASSDLITKFSEYIKSKIFGITETEHGGKFLKEPAALNDAQKYYYYKYYFVNKDICNAKSYGLTSALENDRTTSEVANIRGGKIDSQTYPYVEVPLVDNANGTLNTYSFIMESEQAYTNKDLPIIIDSKTSTTCSDVVAQLTTLSKNVSAEIANLGSNSAVYKKIVADSLGLTAGGGQTATDGLNNGKTTCSIDGIGWLVCPVVNFLANSADGAFSFLAKSFLSTSTKIFSKDNQTYTAWNVMRNFANIAFVIVFLIIIFSQITSVGITNYGIKKMLPRLIIAAVLVNVSYYICQVAVDLSNIVGWSLKDLLAGLVPASGTASRGWLANGGGTEIGFGMIASSVLSITAGIAILYASLSALIPILIAACVALLMILFILIGRQALIVILIVISPLAFVAYMLPNTQDLFKKWQKALTSMLLLFPIIALVFGGSTLAANILSGVFTSDVAGTEQNIFGQIILAGVMILPLFVVPGLLKKSLDGIGGIGTKLNGFGAKVGGALGKVGTKGYDNTALARGRASRKTSMQNYRNQKFARQIGDPKSRIGRTRRFFAGGANVLPGQKYANAQLDKSALATAIALENTEVDNTAATIKRESGSLGPIGAPEITDQAKIAEWSRKHNGMAYNYTPGKAEQELKSALASGDVVKARAATKLLLNSGDVGKDKLHNVLKRHYTSEAMLNNAQNQPMLSAIRTDLTSANLKSVDNSLAKFAFTQRTIADLDADESTYSGLNPAQLLGQTEEGLKRAAGLNNPDLTALANTIVSNKNLETDITGGKAGILTSMTAPTTTTTPTPTVSPILGPNGQPINQPPVSSPIVGSNGQPLPPTGRNP